jgi:hypothetical protein
LWSPRRRSCAGTATSSAAAGPAGPCAAGPAVEQCVRDWLDSLNLDPYTIASYRGQAEKWIYPKIGRARLKTFTAKEADRFFTDLGDVLGKRSLVMIKSTLRRSIRRAQKHDLIGRNVAELADLPEGQPGRQSRAMTLWGSISGSGLGSQPGWDHR